MTIRTLYPKESELIKKAKADDRVAQLMLYNQHAQKMLAVTRYYVKDLQHAEDVLMIAFYKAFTRIHQFKNEINFEGWLRKIIVHEALSFLRKNSNLIVTTTDTTYEDKDYYELVTEEDGEDIQQVIYRLPENQKIVFVLYAIEGYSHQEIAKSLHIPIGTSKSYLSRAREKLQKKLHKTYFKKNGKA